MANSTGEEVAWVLHPDEVAPANFVAATAMTRTLLPCYLVFHLSLLYALFVRNRQDRKERGKVNNDFKNWLLAYEIMSVTSCSAVIASMWSPPEYVPCVVTQKLAASLYVGAMSCSYFLLIVRATLTIGHSSKLVKLLFKVTKLLTYAGPPGLAIVALFVFKGKVLFGEYCTQELPIPVAALFLALDTGLSGQFLLLFILPMLATLKSVHPNRGGASSSPGAGGPKSAKKMILIAKKNLRLSTVAIASTFVLQTVGIITQGLFVDDTDTSLSFLRPVRHAAYQFDLVVNAVAMFMMSHAWIPHGWGRTTRLFGFRLRTLDYSNKSSGYKPGPSNNTSSNPKVLGGAGSLEASTAATSNLMDE